MVCRPRVLLGLLATVTMLAASTDAGAAVLVTNTATAQSAASGGDASFTVSGFDMNGGNFLAVLYSGERSASGSDATDVDVTFSGVGVTNGTPLDTVENEGAQIASVNYGFFADLTGDVIVTLPVAYRGAVTVLALSGVEAVQSSATFGENLGTSTWNESLDGTAGGFVFGAAVDNTFGASANAPTFSGGFIDTLTVSLGADFIAGGSSAGIVQGYGEIDSTGAFTEAFTPGTSGGNSSRNAGAYLTVTAIVPEPGSLVLLGLGGLAIIARRRVA